MFNPSQFDTLEQIENFVNVADIFSLEHRLPVAPAAWLRERLLHFHYRDLPRWQQGLLRQFFGVITGYSPAQLSRHIRRYRAGEPVERKRERQKFPQTYTQADRELLAELDNFHGRLSGEATKNLCELQLSSGDVRFVRLARISKTHLYRFRQSPRYRDHAMTYALTKPVNRSIGERRKPDPQGKPGYIRVDTVHQGDRGKEKGVYHVNLIDVVTQWEVILSVEQISERFLKPILQEALSLFPFTILGFHSDNGSEFINDCVSRILKKLGIEQTKSRPRKSNDNALVESKNGAIIRKWLGHWHIPGAYASRLNIFHRAHLIPYINFIRPCAFPTVEILPDGKRKVRYKGEDYKTPFQKLCSLAKPEQYLKPGITIAVLTKQSVAKSPNDAARDMQEAKRKMFDLILRSGKMS